MTASQRAGDATRGSGRAQGKRSGDSKPRYFLAAQDILAQDGYAGLKQAAICQRLGVTTGAFYHNFKSWQAFTDAFLEHWREERTTLLVALARQESEPIRQLEVLLEASAGLEHRAEASIRIWASLDPEVAKVQRAVDGERYAVVVDAMTPLVGADDALRFAHWGISVLVGYEQLSERQDRTDLEWSLEQVLAAVRRRAHERSRLA